MNVLFLKMTLIETKNNEIDFANQNGSNRAGHIINYIATMKETK